jgi:RNA polymerase sigma-70 factor (ECF subfamily)
MCRMAQSWFDDNTLVSRIRSGDKHAFETLVTCSYTPLLTYLTYAVGTEDVASDLLQELYVQLWRRRDQLPDDRSLQAYLVAAARHRVIDHARTKRRLERQQQAYAVWQVHGAHAESDPQRDVEYAELVRAGQTAVASLPERACEIWRLNREQGLTFTEIAQVLGISVNTVKTQMSRAAAAIRAAIAPFLSLLLAARHF